MIVENGIQQLFVYQVIFVSFIFKRQKLHVNCHIFLGKLGEERPAIRIAHQNL